MLITCSNSRFWPYPNGVGETYGHYIGSTAELLIRQCSKYLPRPVMPILYQWLIGEVFTRATGKL